MKVDLQSFPALFAECGTESDLIHDRATSIVVRKLAGRCALFAGVVGKMSEHIAALEEQIETLKAGQLKPVEPPKEAPKGEEPEEPPAEALNADASADLDGEALAMARRINGGEPVEIEKSSMQKGALT